MLTCPAAKPPKSVRTIQAPITFQRWRATMCARPASIRRRTYTRRLIATWASVTPSRTSVSTASAALATSSSALLVRLEVREHPVGERTRVAALRAADSDPQAEKVLRAEHLRDRAQAVVAGQAAAVLQLEPPEVEVAFVVDDEHVLRRELEERRRRPDRAAGVVHVRLRLQERELLAADADLRHLAGELRAPRAVVTARELVDDHPAGVVPVAGVLAARVPQADDEVARVTPRRVLRRRRLPPRRRLKLPRRPRRHPRPRRPRRQPPQQRAPPRSARRPLPASGR